jgi:CRISPR system Cascade subunit CasE
MYFSLITPSHGQERAAAHEAAASAYEEHQWLWRFLPAPPGTPRRFVFRRRDVDGLPRWYVVSPEPPVAPTPCWDVHAKPYDPVLREGDWLAFELRANPVVTTRGADGRAVRHDVVMQRKKQLLAERGLTRWADWAGPERPALPDLVRQTCADWLRARSDRLGITLDHDPDDPYEDTLRIEGYEQHRGKGGPLRFSSVDFSGTLRVRDPQALRQALFEGVGHARAFGCGLLLVRPLALG